MADAPSGSPRGRVAILVPTGVSALRLRVYRVAGSSHRVIWTRAVQPAVGQYRLRLGDRALRRVLRPGRYLLEATPAGGVPTSVAFGISRS